MAKGSAWKYVVASVVILSLTVHIVCFWVIYVPSAFSRRFKRPACAWTKPQMKRSRQNETPPWISLLADYNATIRSGRNLYLHARGCRQYRLGNILFNYAAVFGIAWHNHRIPIWQKNRNQDITNFFNLRVPTDEENFITRVSLLSVIHRNNMVSYRKQIARQHSYHQKFWPRQREMYALAHLNLSTASFQCLSWRIYV